MKHPSSRLIHSAARAAVLVLCACEPHRQQLELHETPMDGDCLFSAVALSQSLIDHIPAPSASMLRIQANDLLCPNGEPDPELTLGELPVSLLIEPLNGESERQYCRRMRRLGEWGSTAELLALTHVLKRPIEVHTAFGKDADVYGADSDSATRIPLSIHFENSHYRAATVKRLRGGGSTGTGSCDEAEKGEAEETEARRLGSDEGAAAADASASEPAGGGTAGGGAAGGSATGGGASPSGGGALGVAAVLDAMHAASSRADAAAYFELFTPDAVFLGTDPTERWPMATFRPYATARFDKGDGWHYDVRERHVKVKGKVAWFDESLHNAKLGACRGSGVLLREGKGPTHRWKIAQYNLLMAIPNDVALDVAALTSRAVSGAAAS